MKTDRQLVAILSVVLAFAVPATQAVWAETPADLSIQGEWIQGGLLHGEVTAGSSVEFLGHDVYVDSDGKFIVGLGRDAPGQVSLQVADKDGQQQQYDFAVEQREYRIQRIEGVEQKYVEPSEESLARIRADGVRVREARSMRESREDFRTDFIWPAYGPISGVYGSQRVFNGVPKRPHYGVDVAAPTGTVVVAPASGVVTLAYDLYYSGWTLIIDHGQGLSSSFLHLNRIYVEVGDRVEQGDEVAEIGATGRVTGPHLDWRMNWLDQRIDPQLLVPPME